LFHRLSSINSKSYSYFAHPIRSKALSHTADREPSVTIKGKNFGGNIGKCLFADSFPEKSLQNDGFNLSAFFCLPQRNEHNARRDPEGLLSQALFDLLQALADQPAFRVLLPTQKRLF